MTQQTVEKAVRFDDVEYETVSVEISGQSVRVVAECISYLSAPRCRLWQCTQINFTVGIRDSLKGTQFEERLTNVGVSSSKARDKIRILAVSKTLALSDIILKLFHTSILRSPEWALSSLPTEISNTQTARLHLFKTFTGPFSGIVIQEGSKLVAPPQGEWPIQGHTLAPITMSAR